MRIPAFVLRKLYVKGSLRRDDDGFRFTLRNSLATATLTALRSLRVDGRDLQPEQVRVLVDGREVDVLAVTEHEPLPFPRNGDAVIRVRGGAPAGRAKVRLEVQSREFGELVVDFEDEVAA